MLGYAVKLLTQPTRNFVNDQGRSETCPYALSSWMMHRMQLLQPLPRHMGVNLRGGNIRMAQ